MPPGVPTVVVDGLHVVYRIHGADTGRGTAAAALRRRIRAGDLLGRFGGEEFVVLLPRTTAGEACQVAERLRTAVGTTSVRTGLGEVAVTVTVSIGIAALGTHGSELLELLTAADAALYRAKTSGRDQVCLLPPTACPSDPRP